MTDSYYYIYKHKHVYTSQKNLAMSSSQPTSQNISIQICLLVLNTAILSIYVGYHPPISNFCTNNTTFTKINNVTIENPAIVDVHKMLGESGKVIQLYRAEGIVEFSFIAVILVMLCCCNQCIPCCGLVAAVGLFISAMVFSIMFIDLYFQDAIPSQCIDSLMGNNFAYYIMQIKVVWSIIFLSLIALILIILSYMSFFFPDYYNAIKRLSDDDMANHDNA